MANNLFLERKKIEQVYLKNQKHHCIYIMILETFEEGTC